MSRGWNLYKTISTISKVVLFVCVTFWISVVLFLVSDIHAFDDYALRFYAFEENVSLVQTFLRLGANVHANNEQALLMAADEGHAEILEILLDHSANVHADHDAALRLAARAGHTEIIKILLEHGADIHAQNDLPLKVAIVAGQIKAVQYLLSRGADVSGCKGIGMLQAAKERGYLDIAELIRKRISASHTDKSLACNAENYLQTTPRQTHLDK